ncbi:MAG: hypothetical protein HKN43_09025 [Rhodothermales bacterium]|nr:hypothetical protein [Rhodothermales bacterium]
MRRNFRFGHTGIAGFVSVLVMCCLQTMPVAVAQPIAFGSADDPFEDIPRQWWLRRSTVDVMGGVSLIGAQWRGATRLSASLISRDLAARLSATARAGVFGFRDSDADEAYDALRSIEFVKYRPRRASGLHMRIGPTDRMRIGTGHLVNFYSSQTAWDERTVGAELGFEGKALSIHGFTGDLLLDTIGGGRIALAPFFWSNDAGLQSLRLGFSAVRDLGLPYVDNKRLTGFNADMNFIAANVGEFLLSPYASAAWIQDFGGGIAFGAHLGSDNFIDLARLDLRMGFQRNGSQFQADYFGAFYPVSNMAARIQKAEDLSPDDPPGALAGTRLSRVEASSDFVTEIRVMFFGDFEFWYYFKRNFGDQALSEYHLRLFLSIERFRVSLSQDRGGLRGFFSLFNDLGDQTSLTFRTDYEISNLFWVFVSSRYSYEDITPEAAETKTFIVERRFEPLVGVRVTF